MSKNTKYKKIVNAKSQSGITLIVLVITIVVMLILAGATINMVVGEGGILEQSQKNKKAQEEKIKKEDTEVDNLIEKADEERNKYTNEIRNGTIVQDGETVWDEETHTATIKLKTTEIVPEGTNIQYQIDSTQGTWILYQESGIANLNHGSTVFARLYDGKNKSKETGISIIDGIEPELATIMNLPTSADSGTTITATVTHRDKQSGINLSNCKWIFNDIVNINKEDNIWNTAQTFNTSTNQISITVPDTAKNYYLHVLSVDNAGRKRVTTSVSVKVKAPNPNTPITTGFGKIDIVWLDENNNIIPQPKEPILGTAGNKMTPIKWDGTTEKTANEANSGNDWYEYKAITGNADNNASHWANAKTQNGSYFVWIPRYAYRITYYKSETDNTITGYYDGNGMWSAETGVIKYALEEGIETVEAEDGNKYIVHPAFGAKPKQVGETDADYTTRKTQNINNGGWGNTLTGFWFAKFEMSGTGSTNLASTPGVQSLRDKTIGEFYTIGREATYGQTGSIDSFDNKTSFMNSHMAKNSEWGAVAYLTHSQYGRNGHEIAINRNSSFYTGGAQGETAYTNANNQKQSTTGNTYGIYDMSGGAYEYTAAWNTNTSSYISNGSTFATTGGASTEYATAYRGTSNRYGRHIYTVCKTGDATKEVYVSGETGWFGDSSNFVYSSYPFFIRNGNYVDGSYAGVFYSNCNSGNSASNFGFRAALGPEEF